MGTLYNFPSPSSINRAVREIPRHAKDRRSGRKGKDGFLIVPLVCWSICGLAFVAAWMAR